MDTAPRCRIPGCVALATHLLLSRPNSSLREVVLPTEAASCYDAREMTKDQSTPGKRFQLPYYCETHAKERAAPHERRLV